MNGDLLARIRNLFVEGTLTRRDGATIQGKTRFGRTKEGRELHPYGFSARAAKGKVLFLFEGGDVRSASMLYVVDEEGVPDILDLQDWDSALWTKHGGWVVARDDGTVELLGKDLGGVVKVGELRTQLEKNSDILQTLLSVLQLPIPEPGDGAPSAFQAALKAALVGKAPGEYSQIASTKVFHGTGSA